MAGNIYGLDLGTYEIKVYDERKDEIWKEKSAIATKIDIGSKVLIVSASIPIISSLLEVILKVLP